MNARKRDGQHATANAHRRRVLVLDPSVRSGALLVSAIERLGYKAALSTSGEEGLLAVTHFEPFVVLLDFRIANPDALRVATRILERSDPPKLVALTRHQDPFELRGMLAAGFVAHLQQPVDPIELRSTLHQILTAPPAVVS